MSSSISLMNLRKESLMLICKNANLSCIGGKADLVRRIKDKYPTKDGCYSWYDFLHKYTINFKGGA